MKAYVPSPPVDSYALDRVVDALKVHAPDNENLSLTEDEATADVVILHVIGRRDRALRTAQQLLARGQQYAVIQYCVRSTQRPNTGDWLDLWRGAVLVWSYYDLAGWCAGDGTPQDFRFYHAPLGVNHKVFRWRNKGEREYLIATSGPSALTESVKEAIQAAGRVGGKVLHLGPELNRGEHVTCETGLTDKELVRRYNHCQFVAGLRRTEGFELPAAEGLLCGARPICFDRSHYRQWYGDWAEYIPELPRAYVVDSLTELFQAKRRPVGDRERLEAASKFNWFFIIRDFWDKVWFYGRQDG